MPYYNKTHEKGEQLKSSKKKSRTQEELIASYFYLAGEPLSPSMILDRLALTCPITSVRRSLTNLTNANRLVKLDDYVMGNFGKKEHLWRLRTAKDDNHDQYSLFGG